MNWVGGARSRIKMKQEKKKQTEFFDKKRAQKLGKDGQKNTPRLSQDLIRLQIIKDCCENDLERPCEPKVRQIDLAEKTQTIFDTKKRQAELPMSPFSKASKLDFQGAETKSKLHGNKCFCFNPQMHETRDSHSKRRNKENSQNTTKYSTEFDSGDVNTTPSIQQTTDEFHSFFETPASSTRSDPMMYNPVDSPLQFTDDQFRPFSRPLDDNFYQNQSFSGLTSNLFDSDYHQFHPSSSEDFQNFYSPLPSTPFQEGINSSQNKSRNQTRNTPHQFTPRTNYFRQPLNELKTPDALIKNKHETSNKRQEKQKSLKSVKKRCEKTSTNKIGTPEDGEDPIMDTCKTNDFKKSDAEIENKINVPTLCLDPRNNRQMSNLVEKRDENGSDSTPKIDSCKNKNNFQLINYNNFTINIQQEAVREVAEDAIVKQSHEKERQSRETSTQTSPIVYCNRCAFFQNYI